MKLWLYKHFKWKMYEVVWIARHSETTEKMVVYKALYKSDDYWDNALWVKPKAMFEENVTRDWKTFKRFEYIWDKDYNQNI